MQKKCFNIQFIMDKMKTIKKNGQKFDPPPLGFKPKIFEQNFAAQDLNFTGD